MRRLSDKNDSQLIWHIKDFFCVQLERTYQMNDSKRPAISGQNKYFELRIMTRSQYNFVLIYLFVNTGKSKMINK